MRDHCTIYFSKTRRGNVFIVLKLVKNRLNNLKPIYVGIEISNGKQHTLIINVITEHKVIINEKNLKLEYYHENIETMRNVYG